LKYKDFKKKISNADGYKYKRNLSTKNIKKRFKIAKREGDTKNKTLDNF